MRSWKLLALLAALTVLRPGPAAAQAPETKADLAANAALKYWEAFALMPVLDKDQEKLVSDWSKSALDEPARKVLAASEKSLLYLHRGARLRRCDWSLDYQDGIDLVMPHLGKARMLASLTALDARHAFTQSDWQAGSDNVIALLAMAHHLESEPVFIIQYLVGYAIEAVAIQTAAPFLPELKSVLPGPASTAIDRLRTGAKVPQMVLKEKQIGAEWFLGELKKAEQQKKGSWQEVWKRVLAPPAEGQPPDPNLVKSATTFEQAVKRIEDLLPLYDDLAKVAALPWKEFDAQYPEFVKKAKAASPLAGYVLPNVGHLMPAVRRTETQREMLLAALAVVQGGPDKLKAFRDPYGDGPFEYKALEKGFELRSKLMVRGEPFTLTVGMAK